LNAEHTNYGSLSELLASARRYLELRLDLLRLTLARQVAQVLSWMASALVLMLMLLFFMFSLFLASGFWFGQLLHNYALGFVCNAGLYLFVFLMYWLLVRKPLYRWLQRRMLSLMFTENGSNDSQS
jgi:TRAP-type C4-dicarboxylate transport system permease small subunit